MARQRMYTRSPRFPFAQALASLYTSSPFHWQEVAPGETMTEFRVQCSLRSDPVLLQDNPAYLWFGLFYVPYRLIDPAWPDYVVNQGSLTLSAIGSSPAALWALSDQNTTGVLDWFQPARDLIHNEYFGDENHTLTNEVRNFDADWTVRDAQDANEVTLATAAADITTADIEEAFGERDYQARVEKWDGSYRRYLMDMGVTTPDDMLIGPERLFAFRRFLTPATIVDPSDGSYVSAWTADIDRRFRKPIFFPEAGLVIGLAALCPRIYFETVDPLGYKTPDSMPQPGMMNAHVMGDFPRFIADIGSATERLSFNEKFWKGRTMLFRGKNNSIRQRYLWSRPTTVTEMLYPSTGTVDDGTGTSTNTTLGTRVFGTENGDELRVNGLVNTRFRTNVPRYGVDWRPRQVLA